MGILLLKVEFVILIGDKKLLIEIDLMEIWLFNALGLTILVSGF